MSQRRPRAAEEFARDTVSLACLTIDQNGVDAPGEYASNGVFAVGFPLNTHTHTETQVVITGIAFFGQGVALYRKSHGACQDGAC